MFDIFWNSLAMKVLSISGKVSPEIEKLKALWHGVSTAFPSSVLDDDQSHPKWGSLNIWFFHSIWWIYVHTKMRNIYSRKHCEKIMIMDKISNNLELNIKTEFLTFVWISCYRHLVPSILQEKHYTNKHSRPFMREDNVMPLSDNIILK